MDTFNQQKDMEKQTTERWWDHPAIALCWLLLLIVAGRLIATKWTLYLSGTIWIASLGYLAGLYLGKSRFKPKTVLLFGTCYGIFVIGWRLARVLGRDVLWIDRFFLFEARIFVTATRLATGKPVQDNLLFILLMYILFWWLGLGTGTVLTRSANPWKIVIPSGLVIVLMHSYDPYIPVRNIYLILYLLITTFIITRLVFLHNDRSWSADHFHIPPHLGNDVLRYTFIAVLILLVFAWAIPASADAIQPAARVWERIKEPFQGVRDNFENAFASLKSSVGMASDYYGPNLNLGLGNKLSDEQVFTVLTPAQLPDGVRLYWRARVYDVYADGQWNSNLDTMLSLSPENFNVRFKLFPKRSQGLFSFYFLVNRPVSVIYTAPQPQWVSIPVRGEVIVNPDGNTDVGAFQARPSLAAGSTYAVRSSISGVTVERLRSSSDEYPAWIRQRYLELPSTITPRTLELARQITEGLENPYDKTEAITKYLRENIKYIETLDQIPSDQELVDWFLFESKQGFCNYYATAEVILLRAVGIPARLAVGYAQGENGEVENASTYIVRQKDAHAWPEVYFPDSGWVEFEPTSAQPPLDRPSSGNADKPADESKDSNQNQAITQELNKLKANQSDIEIQQERARFHLLLLGITFFGAGLAILVVWWRQSRFAHLLPPFPLLLERGFQRAGISPPKAIKRWSFHSQRSVLEKAYAELNEALQRLGAKPLPSDTPSERGHSMVSLVPEAHNAVESLLAEYEKTTYSSERGEEVVAEDAGKTIFQLSLRKKITDLFRNPRSFLK